MDLTENFLQPLLPKTRTDPKREPLKNAICRSVSGLSGDGFGTELALETALHPENQQRLRFYFPILAAETRSGRILSGG